MPQPSNSPVILVTGAARRVGAATVRLLHAEGARVAVHYHRSDAEATALVSELNTLRPSSAACFKADLLDFAALPTLIEAVIAHWGCLTGLVNNASSFYATPVGTITPEQWFDLSGSNVAAPLFLSQAAAPYLSASHGAIVNIVDIHAVRPLKDFVAYSVAKAALAGLTRSLAVELAPNVRVNGVSPGPVMWPTEGEHFDSAEQRRIIATTPLGREGSAADIASAVVYLMLHAPYVTGQIIAVDGGREVYI
jgi:pteridine reductase